MTGGRPRVPVTFSLLAQREKSPKRKGTPARRHTSLARYGDPVLLAQHGGLRNSRQAIFLITLQAGDICGKAGEI